MSATEYTAIARQLADRLADRAIWHNGMCTFVTHTAEPRGGARVVSRTCGGSLYDGTAGIARFLGHFGARQGNGRWVRTALGCLAHAFDHVNNPGLYDGLSGVCTVSVELGLLLNESRLVEGGVATAHKLVLEANRRSEDWDLTGGIAGVITALAAIGIVTGEGALVQAATELGEILIRYAQHRPEGASYRSPARFRGEEADDLYGMAHGTSGAALALELLGIVTSDSRWLVHADRARRYERTGFDPRSGGWVDLRGASGVGQHFWCHGSAGVGAERLFALGNREETLILTDVGAAIRGLESWMAALLTGPHGPGRPFEANLSVCHGLGGAVDVLLTAAAVFDETRFVGVGRSVASLASRYLETGEIPCGVLEAGEVPGFMLGSAGIGHVIARVEDPEGMPPATLPPLLHVPVCGSDHHLGVRRSRDPKFGRQWRGERGEESCAR